MTDVIDVTSRYTLFPTSQSPSPNETMTITWSVWVSIQFRRPARSA